MTKYITPFVLILLFLSCSEDKSIPDDSAVSDNKLTIRYRGYYEEYFELPDKVEEYNHITVSQIEERISTTEELNLLQVVAKSDDNDNVITFTVIANSVGNNALYNNKFTFRSTGGATYFPSSLNFQVLANKGAELKANFSGKLEHYNQYDDVFVYLDIRSASIEIKY